VASGGRLAPAAAALLAFATPRLAAEEHERPRLDVSGYLQVDYRRGDAGSQPSPEHEINARRARVGLSGKVDDRVSFALSAQGDGLNANSASLIDASVTVRLTSWLRAVAGQYKYDFDIQGRESAAALTFSDRPHATQTVAGGLDGASTPSSTSGSFRDRGVSLTAAAPSNRLQASLGLFQGSGRSSDKNSSFAPVVRIQGSPVQGLLLSGGFLYADTVPTGEAGPGSYRAWTLGAAFERGRYRVRGEYYGARRERSGRRDDVKGFYAHAVRRIGGRFEAMARYQWLEDPLVLAGGSLSSVDLGGRYYLARIGAHGGTSLLVNALLRQAPDTAISGVSVLNDGRGAQLTQGADVEPVVVARLQVQF
jgi:hypothetical protein